MTSLYDPFYDPFYNLYLDHTICLLIKHPLLIAQLKYEHISLHIKRPTDIDSRALIACIRPRSYLCCSYLCSSQ